MWWKNKLKRHFRNCQAILDTYEVIKLKSISTPIHKKTTQRDLVNVFEKFKDLQLEFLQAHTTLDENEIKTIVTKMGKHKKVMDNFVGEFLLAES